MQRGAAEVDFQEEFGTSLADSAKKDVQKVSSPLLLLLSPIPKDTDRFDLSPRFAKFGDNGPATAAAVYVPDADQLAKGFVDRRTGGDIVLGKFCAGWENISRKEVSTVNLQLDILKNPLIRTLYQLDLRLAHGCRSIMVLRYCGITVLRQCGRSGADRELTDSGPQYRNTLIPQDRLIRKL
jgi:hypothetical protein